MEAALAVIGGVVLIYAVLLVLLALYARKHPETVSMKEALRKAGHGPLEQHWTGTPAGLAIIQRLAGTAAPAA